MTGEIKIPLARLIKLLESTDKKLETLLGSNQVKVDENLKVVLGAISDDDPTKVRPLFNTDGRIPVQNELIESDLHHIKRECTNGGVNAGNQTILIEPAADSIVLFYWLAQLNEDTVNRQLSGWVRTSGGVLFAYTHNASISANGIIVFPRNSAGATTLDICAKPSLVLTDAFELQLIAAAIAVSQNASFFVLYSYIGDAPTITEANPAGATWSDRA